MWVDFFFVLSGFILSYVYGKNFQGTVKGAAFKKYVGSRFARVYPLHLFTLLWALAATICIVRLSDGLDPFFAVIFNPKAFPSTLVLLQGMNLYITPPLNTPSWSLSTEWWVYMIFPFLVPVFSRLKLVGKLVAFAAITALFFSLMYLLGPIAQPFPTGQPHMNLVADYGFLRCLAGFLLGMLLLEIYQAKTGYRLFKQSWTFVVLFAGVVAAMHFGIHDLIIIGSFPLIILAAAYNDSSIKKLLDTRPLQRLGDWSFSIYMVHIPIVFTYYVYVVSENPKHFSDIMALMNQKPDYLTGWIMCGLWVAASLVVASLTYRFIEVPARNALNKRFATKTRKVVPESVEV
jgi:peptidoglycan/LPS O-acetylase OafA/YrhL